MCADLSSNKPGESVQRWVDGLSATVSNTNLDERALRKGIEGEEKVARRLALLGDGWLSLHSICVNASGTDIDHLLIGPGGVYTLNTKNHSGQSVWVAGDVFMVSGFRQDYVFRSRSESENAARILSRECGFEVNVEPLIVVIAENCCVKEEPRDVHVLELEALRFWLRRRPVALTAKQVATIYARARESSTWLPKLGTVASTATSGVTSIPDPVDMPQQVSPNFEHA
jgi:hypothetical protein